MNTSIIHESGALILDSSDFQMMDKDLRPVNSKSSQGVSGLLKSAPVPLGLPGSPSRVDIPHHNANEYDHGFDDDDDDHMGGGGGDWAADNAADFAHPHVGPRGSEVFISGFYYYSFLTRFHSFFFLAFFD